LIENLCCQEYVDLEENIDLHSNVNIGNMNRLVELRKIFRTGLNSHDLAYAVSLGDIIRHQNKYNQSQRYFHMVKSVPKKLVKTAFNKNTVAKYLSIDGRNFGTK